MTAGLSPPGGKAGTAGRENISPLPTAPAVAAHSAGETAPTTTATAIMAATSTTATSTTPTATTAATTATATTTAPALIDIPETDWANFDWSQHLLKKVMAGKDEGKITPGTIFQPQQVPTAALYNMLAMIQTPDPSIQLFADDNTLIAERCTERYLDFMNYINKFHAFFAKHVRGRNTAFDDIIHRFSFVFTIGLAQHCGVEDIALIEYSTDDNHLLTRIAEKVDEKRFSLWFGTDTICKVDEAKMQVVFSVRNEFAMKSIRTHCDLEVREVTAEHLPNGFRVFYDVNSASVPVVSTNLLTPDF